MKHRILQLIGSFHRGGTELQTIQLACLLRDSGRFDVRIASNRVDGGMRDEVAAMGFGDMPAFKLTSFYDRNFVVQLARFRRFVRDAGISLVHSHDFYTNMFGMLGAASAGVAVRVASRRETNGVRTPFQRFAEKRAFGLAHMVVANADAVRDQVVAEGLRAAKVVTIHNGIDAARFQLPREWPKEKWRARLGLPAHGAKRLVTIVANLQHEVKDQETFLRAARIVREAIPDVGFVLAGEGERQGMLMSLGSELGISDATFFPGRCSNVPELLALSAVGVLSSTAEGFSNAILEYMAAGLPVVATNVGGAQETIVEGRTGYLVPPRDPVAMANRIVALLRAPKEAATMGGRGRELVTSSFSLEARLARTEALYATLLCGRGLT